MHRDFGGFAGISCRIAGKPVIFAGKSSKTAGILAKFAGNSLNQIIGKNRKRALIVHSRRTIIK